MPQQTHLPDVWTEARELRDRGDLDGARLLLEDSLDTGTFQFGEDHPDVLATGHLLATMHHHAGDLTSARRVLEEALHAGSLRLRDDEPVMLRLSFELARVADELGNRHEARKHYNRVVTHGQLASGFAEPVREALAWLGQHAPTTQYPQASAPPQWPLRPSDTAEHPTVTPAAAHVHQSGYDPVQGVYEHEPVDDYDDEPVVYEQPVAYRQPAAAYDQPVGYDQPVVHDQPVVYEQYPEDREQHWNDREQRWEDLPPQQQWNAREQRWEDMPQQQWSEPARQEWSEPAQQQWSEPVRRQWDEPEEQWDEPSLPSLSGPLRFPDHADDQHEYVRFVPEAVGPVPVAVPVPLFPSQPTVVVERRGRGPMLAAIGAAVTAVVAAGVAVVVMLSGSGGTPAATPTTGAAQTRELNPPTGVAIVDNGDAITITWTDPGGTNGFAVMMGPNEKELRLSTQNLGVVSTKTINGLNTKFNYCIQIIAIYSASDQPVRSETVCTKRTGAP
ncbi:hypothetical protein F4553_002542 [Allocatelliglobosispora scoriae]|uniref:Tetratricopeptide repeat protein n=1 Tax=Allocatelliglobosispora scoriae TaxID=643052 RepID=A0A841BQF0_9ACTN|nr:tetratricopeptide repeat protein [Allocatelliglobosispora scoriae]MBB5869163.1 hypothetical protein [Allocatelliglobosispora scoriae]